MVGGWWLVGCVMCGCSLFFQLSGYKIQNNIMRHRVSCIPPTKYKPSLLFGGWVGSSRGICPPIKIPIEIMTVQLTVNYLVMVGHYRTSTVPFLTLLY